jgi:hypothetical protein
MDLENGKKDFWTAVIEIAKPISVYLFDLTPNEATPA